VRQADRDACATVEHRLGHRDVELWGSAMSEDLEPMYTEVEAARRLGIKPRSLRTERQHHRIGHKPVAGKIMYRHSDLVAWQRRGETCREDDPMKAQNSSSVRKRCGNNRSGASAGVTPDATASVQRAQATAAQLINSSRAGSSREAEASKSHSEPARVIPLKP
jgi:hypothetical protein